MTKQEIIEKQEVIESLIYELRIGINRAESSDDWEFAAELGLACAHIVRMHAADMKIESYKQAGNPIPE